MREVIRELVCALEQGQERILCQVVETKGSTPQKAGALMCVDPDGRQVGTLGGGCVEAEVKQKAIRLLGESAAELHSYVLDHDYAWADGLICGGKMVIIAESFRGSAALAYLREWQRLVELGEGFTEAVVLDPSKAGSGSVGSRCLFDADGHPVASLPPGVDSPTSYDRITPLKDRPKPGTRGGVAFLPTLPRIRLVIVGAGHVGQEVGSLAARSDFEVWVVDDRHQYANPERFPDAARLIVGPIDQVLAGLEITPQTYALVVTRGHGHDQEALYYLAPTSAAYVGLIGSGRKIRMILESLREQGLAEADLARVVAPVGLDIGSQSVPEIAVSIVAELIARRNIGPQAISGKIGQELFRGEPAAS